MFHLFNWLFECLSPSEQLKVTNGFFVIVQLLPPAVVVSGGHIK
jgi:hypothetical protein